MKQGMKKWTFFDFHIFFSIKTVFSIICLYLVIDSSVTDYILAEEKTWKFQMVIVAKIQFELVKWPCVKISKHNLESLRMSDS